jgi:cold shock CspA family protein
MSIMDSFKPHEEAIDPFPEQTKRVRGKIYLIDESGYGFIISKEVPFRRIFFHWTFLEGDTLTFDKLEEGMIVEFKPVEIPEKGWRAIKIRILEGEERE